MALWVCEECGTKYAVGVPTCPQCGSGRYHEDGSQAARPAAWEKVAVWRDYAARLGHDVSGLTKA